MSELKSATMNSVPEHLKQPLAQLLLSIADDKLFLGHRNSDWTGLGPILEEDIAFSHLAQDEIAHAQVLYEFVGNLINKKADDLAFGRKSEEYRCAAIVEVPDEFDWATALCRQFFCDHFDRLRFRALSQSNIKPLADLARRIAAEEEVHVQHSDSWIIRLGRAGGESRIRLERAWFEKIFAYAGTLFEPTKGEELLVNAGIIPQTFFSLFSEWSTALNDVLQLAGLPREAESALQLVRDFKSHPGGRHGVHTEHFKPLLDEMCEVYRLEPGAAW